MKPLDRENIWPKWGSGLTPIPLCEKITSFSNAFLILGKYMLWEEIIRESAFCNIGNVNIKPVLLEKIK